MNRYVLIFLLLSPVLVLFSCMREIKNKPAADDIDLKVKALVSQMTLEEKAGQMTQVTLDLLTEGKSPEKSNEPLVLDTAMLKEAFGKYQIGSVLNAANNRARDRETWNRLIGRIQEYAIAHSRLKIPVIYGLDMIHGASYVAEATLFPQQIGMAATWNPGLISRAGEITAYESRAAGCPWTFSPVMDLGLDPRWPRQWETFGEDPLLASTMGSALISGLQGNSNDPGNDRHIAACLKHYLGYSQPVSGKDRTPALIPMHVLREYHLPAFRKGIESGALTVMINSGEVNCTPVHASHELINGLLKEELGFKGLVVSDWQDIEFLHTRHKVAGSHKEAVKIAINAGIDMSMVPYNFRFADYVVELAGEGEIPMSRIDDAVSRILRVKYLLGLFDRPVTKQADYPDFASADFASDARRAALESITLLKNEDDVLPLPADAKILVCGPAADNMRPLLGGWSYSWQGNLVNEFTEGYSTIYESIRDLSSRPGQVELYEGVVYSDTGEFRNERKQMPDKLAGKAAKADYIVICAGENSYTEFSGNDTGLDLSDNQQELIRVAASTGKPVILVLVQGRPRIIRPVEPLVKAILNAYLPGNYGGEALARILFGETNPSGKLPYSYPKYAYSLEPYYHKHTEALKIKGVPSETTAEPQYSFGFGLSYSRFVYKELKPDKKEYHPGETVRISVKLQNNSGREGMETVQVFVSDHYASLTPPVKRLRAFSKVMLQPGESRTINLEFPVNDLAFVNQDNQLILEKGDFTLSAGGLSQTFTVAETRVLEGKAK
jgi:beta-glucosidase